MSSRTQSDSKQIDMIVTVTEEDESTYPHPDRLVQPDQPAAGPTKDGSFDLERAQGCPLSPLLFLVVAEGLRVSLDMEAGFKGIKVGTSYYKLSQFADDTTVLMGDKKEIKYVNRAIQRWCGATGMRENIAKREEKQVGR